MRSTLSTNMQQARFGYELRMTVTVSASQPRGKREYIARQSLIATESMLAAMVVGVIITVPTYEYGGASKSCGDSDGVIAMAVFS